MGTQHGEYEGQPTVRNQVLVQWELCNEKMESGEPFTIGEFYTNSLGKKAKLRAHLEAWRGRAFTDEELAGFDLEKILGAPCMLSVIENEKKKSKVGGVSAMPKGMQAPAAVNQPWSFWIEDWNEKRYSEMSEGLRKIIDQSEERKSRGNSTTKSTGGGSIADMDDDIPF